MVRNEMPESNSQGPKFWKLERLEKGLPSWIAWLENGVWAVDSWALVNGVVKVTSPEPPANSRLRVVRTCLISRGFPFPTRSRCLPQFPVLPVRPVFLIRLPTDSFQILIACPTLVVVYSRGKSRHSSPISRSDISLACSPSLHVSSKCLTI